MFNKNKHMKFYFCEDKIKFLSDETSKVRSTLLYLSSLCIVLMEFNGQKVKSIFGISFSGYDEANAIDVDKLIIFLSVAIFYTLIHFMFKSYEDYKAYSPSNNNIDRSLIKGITIKYPDEFSFFDSKPKEHLQYFETFRKEIIEFKNDIDKDTDIISKQQKQVGASHAYIALEAIIDLISNNEELQNFTHKSGIFKDNVKVFEDVKKSMNIAIRNSYHSSTLDRIIQNLNNKIADMEVAKNSLTTSVKSLEKHQESIDKSITDLEKSINKRAVNTLATLFFNNIIPILFSVGTLVYVICELSDVTRLLVYIQPYFQHLGFYTVN